MDARPLFIRTFDHKTFPSPSLNRGFFHCHCVPVGSGEFYSGGKIGKAWA
jgi:hypothetical protein